MNPELAAEIQSVLSIVGKMDVSKHNIAAFALTFSTEDDTLVSLAIEKYKKGAMSKVQKAMGVQIIIAGTQCVYVAQINSENKEWFEAVTETLPLTENMWWAKLLTDNAMALKDQCLKKSKIFIYKDDDSSSDSSELIFGDDYNFDQA
jgi:hypothetical protein